MKKKIRIPVILLVLILAFSSCTINKRVYMKGYHMEWKQRTYGNNIGATAKTESEADPVLIHEAAEDPSFCPPEAPVAELIASATEEPVLIPKSDWRIVEVQPVAAVPEVKKHTSSA